MDKFIKILNVIIKIIFDIVVFGIFFINATLFRSVYDLVLPEAPDWPAHIFVILMGGLYAYVIGHINRDDSIIKKD